MGDAEEAPAQAPAPDEQASAAATEAPSDVTEAASAPSEPPAPPAEAPAPPAEAPAAHGEPHASHAEVPAAPAEAPAAHGEAPAAQAEAPAAHAEPRASRVEPRASRIEPRASRVEPRASRVEPAAPSGEAGAPSEAAAPQAEGGAPPEHGEHPPHEKSTEEGLKHEKKSMADARASRLASSTLTKSKIDMSKFRRSTKDFRTWSRLGYQSLMSIKRGSFASFQDRQKVPKYMNSYKLESERPFNPDKVKTIIVDILKTSITDSMMYDVHECPAKAKQICGVIRQRVKEQDYDRYKVICLVTIGEKKSHDIFTGVRFLWDAERDRFATHFHENMYIFVVVTVFGVYYE